MKGWACTLGICMCEQRGTSRGMTVNVSDSLVMAAWRVASTAYSLTGEKGESPRANSIREDKK